MAYLVVVFQGAYRKDSFRNVADQVKHLKPTKQVLPQREANLILVANLMRAIPDMFNPVTACIPKLYREAYPAWISVCNTLATNGGSLMLFPFGIHRRELSMRGVAVQSAYVWECRGI